MGRKGKSNHRRNEALRRSRREPVSRQPHMQTSGRRQRHRRRSRRLRRRRRLFGIVVVLILAAGMAGIFLWKRSHTAGSPPTSENKGGSKDTKKKDAQSGTSDYTIELQGDSEVTVRLGDPYEDAGAVVKDRQGNRTDISVSLEEYDLNTAGEHQLVYKATDPKGKEISAQRTVTVTPNKEYGAKGLPICMYHYVYDANSVPENLNSNYIEVGTLEEELKYLHENDYYFRPGKK